MYVCMHACMHENVVGCAYLAASHESQCMCVTLDGVCIHLCMYVYMYVCYLAAFQEIECMCVTLNGVCMHICMYVCMRVCAKRLCRFSSAKRTCACDDTKFTCVIWFTHMHVCMNTAISHILTHTNTLIASRATRVHIHGFAQTRTHIHTNTYS